jgi:hypothetical protein
MNIDTDNIKKAFSSNYEKVFSMGVTLIIPFMKDYYFSYISIYWCGS